MDWQRFAFYVCRVMVLLRLHKSGAPCFPATLVRQDLRNLALADFAFVFAVQINPSDKILNAVASTPRASKWLPLATRAPTALA